MEKVILATDPACAPAKLADGWLMKRPKLGESVIGVGNTSPATALVATFRSVWLPVRPAAGRRIPMYHGTCAVAVLSTNTWAVAVKTSVSPTADQLARDKIPFGENGWMHVL